MPSTEQMTELMTRANNACELCAQIAGLRAIAVPPHDEATLSHGLVVCDTRAAQLAGDVALDDTHWACLQDSAWSQEAPVQVTAYRLLSQIEAPWAAALQAQLYLPEEVLAWADNATSAASGMGLTLDSNGAVLAEGDSVTLIKDLNVKGAGFTAKRGTMVRRIHLTDDPELVEGKVNGTQIVLKTCFLKKSS